MPKRYYITTPIYYVNSVPHIGTTLTTFISDVTARYQKMQGREVTFLTGTDENGLKVKEAALAAGKQPQQFVDEISEKFKAIFEGMDIRFDDFIRTTEPRHFAAVQEVFRRLQAKGYIYTGKYEGWYDISSETFFKEAELVDGKSPDGNEVRWVEEENYFFKLSAFEKPLLEHIEKNPNFILPEARRNEVISYIKQGLRDASISRANDGWGVPIPGDEKRVVYVWFDALINYLSATGWPASGYENYWPADVEFMGKDILTRFHATLWPGILMGLDLPLPTTLVGHAWLLIGQEKISKSKGNVVRPLELAEELVAASGCEYPIAIDAVRYYMASSLPFENDTTFTHDEFYKRYNSDLANDLGNGLNRSLAMAHKFVDGKVPAAKPDMESFGACTDALAQYNKSMKGFRIDHATDAVWGVVRFLNKYIDTKAPWALAKAQDPKLNEVLASMLFSLRFVQGLLIPILPATAAEIADQLSIEDRTTCDLDITEPGTPLKQPRPIFPRIDLTKMQTPQPEPETPKPEVKAPEPAPAQPEQITIEDFMKVQLRVGRVLEAEAIEGATKLLKLQVMLGSEKRQIVAGIAANYAPIDLIGRQVIVVANLKPAKLRGVESQGMLLAAVDENNGAILLQPEKEAPDGGLVR
ncbi:MAG TPA: methionine--tRNA ligase [Fimbriimonadaceae bacterium]|jgi:methionyl-tRNA synthetase